MSKCISSHGEYSEHEPGDPCSWCGEYDTERIIAERDEWRQTALDERAAALDALEQVKVRDARIKAVRDVLEQKDADLDAMSNPPREHRGVLMADIRRALDA